MKEKVIEVNGENIDKTSVAERSQPGVRQKRKGVFVPPL